MKRILTYALGLIVITGLYGVYYVHAAPCTKPITYRIGTFDTKFGITKDEYLSIVKQATAVWGKPLGKELFLYDPKGDMTVNLIYDSRQATTVTNKGLESIANQTKQSADSVKSEYLALEAQYENAKSEYQTLSAEYTSREKAYNSSVDYYNTHGGAPKTEYDKLVLEKASLARMASVLETKRIAINTLAGQINSRIKDYNLLVDQANSKINTINQSAGKEFNEGEYVVDNSGRRINIYEFTSRDELKRVLAHEFGHALGLMHGTDPDSIMYYLNKSRNIVPTAEDKAMLASICKNK